MAGPKPLAKKQLQTLSQSLDHFVVAAADKKLVGTFTFATHVEGLVFIARITVYAEVENHHPDIQYTYRKVKVTLTTHDVKGLTKKDTDLAKKIELLYKKYKGDKKD